MLTTIITSDDAYPLFRAAMDRVDGKESIFVLPLDADGRKITNPTLVAFGEEKTAECEPKTAGASCRSWSRLRMICK